MSAERIRNDHRLVMGVAAVWCGRAFEPAPARGGKSLCANPRLEVGILASGRRIVWFWRSGVGAAHPEAQLLRFGVSEADAPLAERLEVRPGKI